VNPPVLWSRWFFTSSRYSLFALHDAQVGAVQRLELVVELQQQHAGARVGAREERVRDLPAHQGLVDVVDLPAVFLPHRARAVDEHDVELAGRTWVVRDQLVVLLAGLVVLDQHLIAREGQREGLVGVPVAEHQREVDLTGRAVDHRTAEVDLVDLGVRTLFCRGEDVEHQLGFGVLDVVFDAVGGPVDRRRVIGPLATGPRQHPEQQGPVQSSSLGSITNSTSE
jgi:hypothetical protein